MRQEAVFDPFAPGFAEDPYPCYAEMRENDPVHEASFGAWVLFCYEDVVGFLRNPDLSVEEPEDPVQVAFGERRRSGTEARGHGELAMINRDPPGHTRLRRLVSKVFTPRAVEGMRPRIRRLVCCLLDEAEGHREIDLIGQLAFPLPFAVISEMLGLPDGDVGQLRSWSGAIVRSLEPVVEPELVPEISRASENMVAYLRGVVRRRRRHPTDDLLSALIRAEEGGDALSEDELLEQVVLLFIAGHETTVNLIGNGVLALLRHRSELERLQEDPRLVPNAVEELLRYDAPVQHSRRRTLADVSVRDTSIEAGSYVVLTLGSANRDPGRWGPDAETLDVGRRDAREHVSFGGGRHYCLGAALARLEGELAIKELVDRFPEIELAGAPEWNGRLNLRGLEQLPVVLGASRSAPAEPANGGVPS